MPHADGATIRPIETSGRRDAILEALTDFIVSSKLAPGDRLPPERELMAGLKVGRSSIREAIGHMQALGVVEIRRGSGTYLKRPVSEKTLFMPLSIATQRDGLLQTLEVRRGLEVEASMLAAKRATAQDIDEMRAALDAMEAEHLEFGTAGEADLVFHLSIYKASGNPLFEQLLGQMREAFESFFAQPFNRPDFASSSFEFHRMLFDAIVAGDAELARQHTLAILEVVENDIVRMSDEEQQ
ncbi:MULTISPECIES: FadR/GntR family transcriptional regulator [Thalassospira]|uniref:FadR/GntR family transcriptional regulator n=1 Tax=Thalassospira TaxID=168934 RepID=UPI000C69C8C7|nr:MULTISPECIES: FadR/GntR family transcriptional regulator [Thalassospira]RCK24631.1 GntR family transcriptional regulator [Thalassospira profundimaris]MAL41648.1 GntR family transcriptional regulator [Thalassospira sp.]MCC4238710.1 FadR family transcriptional regulator [Thalassospira povalilytica]URK19390.1 FadR family transcriptional regulator [Thalassospira sp. GO-4]HAY48689.1 GntR family transcriptional regulator [Thalassospira sp.]